jgi:hypothetical protein
MREKKANKEKDHLQDLVCAMNDIKPGGRNLLRVRDGVKSLDRKGLSDDMLLN